MAIGRARAGVRVLALPHGLIEQYGEPAGPTLLRRQPAGPAGASRPAYYSYRYLSMSTSACSISAIVSPGIRSWASVTSAEVGWASAGSH